MTSGLYFVSPIHLMPRHVACLHLNKRLCLIFLRTISNQSLDQDPWQIFIAYDIHNIVDENYHLRKLWEH